MHRLWASLTDAAFAGMEAVWNIRDWIAVIKHASYTSNRKNYTPVPGQAGLHITGTGAINRGLFCVKEFMAGNLGQHWIAPAVAAGVVVYCNPFLASRKYEEIRRSMGSISVWYTEDKKRWKLVSIT